MRQKCRPLSTIRYDKQFLVALLRGKSSRERNNFSNFSLHSEMKEVGLKVKTISTWPRISINLAVAFFSKC